MTPKQQRFAVEYLVDLNATQAAIRAGYSKKTARSQGSDLLTKPDIQAAIQKANQRRLAKVEITAARVLEELGKIGFANLGDYLDDKGKIDVKALTPEQTAALSEITVEGDGKVKIKLADKRAALVDIGRHFKMFTDKFEHTGADGGPIEVESPYERILGRIARLAAGRPAEGGAGGSD